MLSSGRAGSVRLAYLRFCLLRRQRTKVTGTWRCGVQGSAGSPWMARSVQNLSLGSSMGQTVEMESLGWAGGDPRMATAVYILFMFALEFKPQFLNYPLDPQEYARVTLRAGEVAVELARLQGEMQSLQSQPEYGPFDEDSRDRYAQYLLRLRERAVVLAEEQKECQQVVALHLSLDGQAQRHRQDRPEVRNRLLEHYKAAMIAKRAKRAAERMKEVELERRMLEEGEGMTQVGSLSAAVVPTLKNDLNPERHIILGRFQQPTLNYLRFRNSQTEQKSSKMGDSRKSSLNKSFKLPQISKSPHAHDRPDHTDHPGLLVMSSPMKFSKYSLNQPLSHSQHL